MLLKGFKSSKKVKKNTIKTRNHCYTKCRKTKNQKRGYLNEDNYYKVNTFKFTHINDSLFYTFNETREASKEANSIANYGYK